MTTDASAPTTQPLTFSVEEVGKRFLKLIEGLKTRDDITPERIHEVFGVLLTVKPGELGASASSNDLGGGWTYGIVYYPESASTSAGVGLTFVNGANQSADMSAVCALDFDYYHKALVAMGFLAEPYYGDIGELRDWRYTKFRKDNGLVDFTLSIIPQNLVAGKASPLCIKWITTLNGR